VVLQPARLRRQHALQQGVVQLRRQLRSQLRRLLQLPGPRASAAQLQVQAQRAPQRLAQLGQVALRGGDAPVEIAAVVAAALLAQLVRRPDAALERPARRPACGSRAEVQQQRLSLGRCTPAPASTAASSTRAGGGGAGAPAPAASCSPSPRCRRAAAQAPSTSSSSAGSSLSSGRPLTSGSSAGRSRPASVALCV
jgi:hypothetical protein